MGSQAILSDDTPAILVTSNCVAALKRLRNSDLIYGKGIWVDAICIDQASKVEKNLQVAMMAEIYRKAKDVAVWLGDKWAPKCYKDVSGSTKWYPKVIDHLPEPSGWSGHFMRRVKRCVVGFAFRGTYYRPSEAFGEPSNWLLRLGTEKELLMVMIQAPYWKRAWSLQESTV